jgi:hypothetical protein
MRYVIFRDDDTNAFTPVECLERLYRPFLDRGLPVNLATIPAVSRNATMANGEPEGFLPHKNQSSATPNLVRTHEACGKDGASAAHELAALEGGADKWMPGASPTPSAGPLPYAGHAAHAVTAERRRFGADQLASAGAAALRQDAVPIGSNGPLVKYLNENPGYRIVQHGCHHDYLEFERANHSEIIRRLEYGSKLIQEAGFAQPRTFVAPYDKLSREGLREVAARFRVLSTGWYELRRLPYSWWPRYGFKKLRKCAHWRVGQTLLLSHPGCLLSCQRTYSTMLGGIIHYLNTQQLTVLVTHWWEYFRGPAADSEFIDFLHETASYVATHPELKVISFDDLVSGEIQLN